MKQLQKLVDVKTIGKKPAKRWDLVVTTVITTIVGIVIGYLFRT